MTKRPWNERQFTLPAIVLVAGLLIESVVAADSQNEWKKIVNIAKKEGKIVAGGPPTAILRQKYKETFEKKFGIELELISAPGPQNAGRAAAEFKAGDCMTD